MKRYNKMKIYKHLDDLDLVKKIIEAGGDVNRIYRKTKEHALFFALEETVSLEVFKCLIEAGCDLNYQNKKGDSLIHLCDDHEKLVCLLEAGADVNLKNKASLTPIFNCLDHTKVQLLVDFGCDLSVVDAKGEHFLKSIHVSDFDLMKIFIDKGMNRLIERKGLTLDAFLENWSTREIVAYYENKLRTHPELYDFRA